MRVWLFVTVLAAASLQLACRQGVGDLCQVDDDCESPLQCNDGTKRCQRGSGGAIDAAEPFVPVFPPDAAPPDARPPDAAALPDAGIDAAPP